MGGGHHHHGPTPEAMPKEDQDLQLFKDKKVPLAHRDNCGHLIVQLNDCRHRNFYRPDKCGHYRHIYEECEHIAWQKRVEDKTKINAAAAAAAQED